MHPASEAIAPHSGQDWFRAHPNRLAALMVAAALLVRLRAAAGTYLNPDEVLHFSAANQHSFLQAYRASLTISHPPLLVLVLYFWRALGTSEFVLRLPSVLLGTAFCWVFFKWLNRLFGLTVGWIGLVFAGFLPAMIALSAEIRQYALLLFFAACAGYFLEWAFAENSAGMMLVSLVSLYLALLSHYSAVLFAGAVGAYGLLRVSGRSVSRSFKTTWAIGQAGGLGLCSFLYLTSVKTLGRFFQGQPLHAWMGESYLHNSYFDAARHQAFLFIASRTGSVFQYVFAQDVVGDIAFLLFLGGIVLLLKDKTPVTSSVSHRLLAIFLVLPFALNCAAAFAGAYPYGGTRHCVFLALFAFAGVAFLLARLVRQRIAAAVVVALVVTLVCTVFESQRLPYISRADQGIAHMQQAVSFVRQQIPSPAVLFVDNQTSLVLTHYLCPQNTFSVYQSMHELSTLECAGDRIIATSGRIFVFKASSFFPAWEQMVRTYGLKAGDPVWVVQAGWLWGDSLADDLGRNFPQFRDFDAHTFGRNITIFKLIVGSNGLPVTSKGSVADTT